MLVIKLIVTDMKKVFGVITSRLDTRAEERTNDLESM